MLCKDCSTFKSFGFTPLCKYCPSDGLCPYCGEKVKFLKSNPPGIICPNGHIFNLKGENIWELILRGERFERKSPLFK